MIYFRQEMSFRDQIMALAGTGAPGSFVTVVLGRTARNKRHCRLAPGAGRWRVPGQASRVRVRQAPAAAATTTQATMTATARTAGMASL